MSAPPDDILDLIRQSLEYDQDTGELRWTKPRSPRVQPGDYAGSWVERDKRVVVGIDGHVLPATSLAWFLAYDRWPKDVVKLEPDPDRDRMAVPIDALYLASDRRSDKPAAAAMRRYRARRREIDATTSIVKGVKWRESEQVWACLSPRGVNKQYAAFEKKRDAERYQRKLLDALAWLDKHPPRLNPGDDQVFATGDDPERQSMCLAEAKLWFANTPDGLVYRDGPFPGAPAGYMVESSPSERPMIRIYNRYYSAASIAWFIEHGEWPRRKAITFRDGNPNNTSLDNLQHRDQT